MKWRVVIVNTKFGSRLDDNRRGGGIDLLVELTELLSADDTVDRRTLFTARL